MQPWLEGVIGAAGAMLGVGGKTLADRRQHSGKVATTDADALWDEAREIREFQKQQLSEVQTKVDTLEERVDRLTDANDGLRIQLESAHQLVLLLRTEREELTAELDRARTWGDVLVEELKRHDLQLPEKPKRRTKP